MNPIKYETYGLKLVGSLDGINDYAEASGLLSQLEFRTNPFSISLWAYKSNTGISSLINTFDPNYNALQTIGGFQVFWFDDGKILLEVLPLNGANPNTRSSWYTFPNAAPLNRWNHIVVQRVAGTSEPEFYINGNQAPIDPSQTYIGGPFDIGHGYPLRLGRWKPSGSQSYFLGGYLDEVILQRKALSAAEITSRYNNGVFAPNSKDISNLVVYYTFNEFDGGGVFRDESANSYDLILNGYTSAELTGFGNNKARTPIGMT
jgi:hypothetical protein